MRVIKQRLSILIVTSSLGLLVALIIFFNGLVIEKIGVDLVLTLVIMITIIILVFLISEYIRYRAALLIVENKIIHIQAAQIEEKAFNKNDTSSLIGGIEVDISCFGILLDSKVIKFNIGRIKLKGVEIGQELICLSYGTEKTTRKIHILHGAFGKQELQSFVERFRYETGIVPLIRVE